MAVDDSSSSASFRELDDVFLQSQARIWIGQVLHARFDEQLSICDLLSDGELLFEVSKTLWNMLLIKYMELKSYKARMFVPVDTRKSSGRYRPYSNVDSFLKVCKVVGLSGVDLFSPSDVVEKRNTRKVCVCIRSLSTKARSKQLNVPDFDIVTNTVAMSTDAVRCIRRSLELSSMSSVTCGQSKHARLKPRQKISFASHNQEDESYLEECDEAKSHFSDTSYADFLYLESGESPDTVDKDCLCHSCMATGSHNSNTTPNSSISRVWRKLPDDVEASPTSSVLGRVLDFDFEFDAKSEPDDLTTPESSTYDKMSGLWNQSELSSDSFSPWWNDTESVDEDLEYPNKIKKDLVLVKDDVTNIADSMQENVAGRGSNDMKITDPKSTRNVDAIFNDHLGVIFSERCDGCAEDTSKACSKDERTCDGLLKAETEKRAEKKPSYVAPLLKTVAKGTALIGILFLLHLRSDRNTKTEKSNQIHWKSNGVGFSKRKEEKIYPVEKFKFED
ncbi:hypothetical protein L1987_06777 [Smallanthus sonchifolius]|uniref:Uncharacterized protein n=1 Tax=Smallanthus sonchifolius TaxID=185202 RepID=A0ACB9JZ92_9ASTR|nr:hypothetical protein L1987_06777 [Smallanthus sonchifolius]